MTREIRSHDGAVVTPHHAATSIGAQILGRGGNAVDAAVAANAVLGTVAPETCGIGGDLFALVWTGGTVECLDSAGPAGSGVDAGALRRQGYSEVPIHHPYTATVPGCVGGWEALLNRHGTLPLSQLLEPAQELATEGFPVSSELSAAVHTRAAKLRRQPQGFELFHDGRAPLPGETLTRPALASSLGLIRENGAEGFYRGPVARAIATAVGEALTLEDLSGFTPEWVEPLRMDVFGREGWTVPPPSQGYLTLAALRVFELLEPPRDPADPDFAHLLIESYRAVASRRDELLADRRYLPDAWQESLAPDALEQVAGGISRQRAGVYLHPRPVPGGTAFLCVADGNGMGISLIQSNFSGIGSGIGAAGFFLHNRGAGFDLRPGHPNELMPGKKPLHTLSPTMWTRRGRLELLLGTRGGHQQPQLLAQLAALLFHAEIPAVEAVAMPRWTTDQIVAGSESNIVAESRYDRALVAALRDRGHELSCAADFEIGWGPVSIIQVGADGLCGVADPRVDTSAALGPVTGV